MKISIEHFGMTVTAGWTSEDTTIDDMVLAFRGLLTTIGFHPDTISQYFRDDECALCTSDEPCHWKD